MPLPNKTQIYTTDEQFDWIKDEADRRHVPYAEIIREAIEYYKENKVSEKYPTFKR